jgi:hypothetical protein
MGYTAKDLIKVMARNVVCLRSDFRSTQEIEKVLGKVEGIERSPSLSELEQGSADDPRRPYGSVSCGKPSCRETYAINCISPIKISGGKEVPANASRFFEFEKET